MTFLHSQKRRVPSLQKEDGKDCPSTRTTDLLVRRDLTLVLTDPITDTKTVGVSDCPSTTKTNLQSRGPLTAEEGRVVLGTLSVRVTVDTTTSVLSFVGLLTHKNQKLNSSVNDLPRLILVSNLNSFAGRRSKELIYLLSLF